MPSLFEPVEHIDGDPACGLLLLCDHASNAVPPELNQLGLPPDQLARHIGWDIGAAEVTRRLAGHFGAPAVLTRFSRLLIDPNRGADDPTLVMRLSDGAQIPGNARIGETEVARRIASYWRPYHDAVAAQLDTMLATGTVPVILSVHSFTPVWRSVSRPWQIAFLWDRDPRMAEPLIRFFRQDRALTVGDNEPYDGSLQGDTLYTHGTARGLPNVLVELRQDLIASPQGAALWAGRLADGLTPLLDDAGLHAVQHYGSRSDR